MPESFRGPELLTKINSMLERHGRGPGEWIISKQSIEGEGVCVCVIQGQ